MMEEYDKLGAGDGFTRLRIFLFSHSDQDGSVHFVDGDERDNERRYVDALNSLNESPEYRRNQFTDTQFIGPLDDAHVAVAEQFFNQMSLEGGLQNQRNTEMPMPPINLRQLRIPTLMSGQPQQPVTQQYNEQKKISSGKASFLALGCTGKNDMNFVIQLWRMVLGYGFLLISFLPSGINYGRTTTPILLFGPFSWDNGMVKELCPTPPRLEKYAQ
ncbi:hypothetical protein ACH5RR_001531, partial [Cinchona calisaya]